MTLCKTFIQIWRERVKLNFKKHKPIKTIYYSITDRGGGAKSSNPHPPCHHPCQIGLGIVLVAKFVISGILSSILLTLALHSVFLATSFLTALLSLLKSTRVAFNIRISNGSTLLFKLLKPLRTFFNLSISNLSTLAEIYPSNFGGRYTAQESQSYN